MADFLTPDLCVIGAGSSGLAVAEAARVLGASVLVVERDRVGGSALNTGALPAHALAAAAAQLQAMRQAGRFGIAVEGAKVSFRRVHDHIEQVIAAARPATSPAHLEAIGAEFLQGTARFVDKRTLSVGDAQIRARHFVIATGANTIVPAIPGLDEVPYFTTETILDNTRKLTHLLVIGGSPLALELAQSYRRLGSEVTVVVPAQPLEDIDPDLSAVAMRRITEEGVDVRSQSNVIAIQPRSMGIGVVVRTGDGEELLDVSHILVAGTRAPMIDGLDIEKAGIRRTKADPTQLQLLGPLRTTNRRVYVVGEALRGMQSMASSRQQAEEVARRTVLSLPAVRPPVPSVIHTTPSIAQVGLTELAAKQRLGAGYAVLRASYADTVWGRARRETNGVVKVLVDRRGRILGAGIAGEGAAELVALFSLVIARGLKATDLADFVAASPSLAEIVSNLGREARRQAGLPGWVPLWQRLVRAIG